MLLSLSLSLCLSLSLLICRYRGPPTSPLFVRAGTPNYLCSVFSSLRGPAVSRGNKFSPLLLLRLVPPSPSPPPPSCGGHHILPTVFLRLMFRLRDSPLCCTPPLKGTFMRLRRLEQRVSIFDSFSKNTLILLPATASDNSRRERQLCHFCRPFVSAFFSTIVEGRMAF